MGNDDEVYSIKWGIAGAGRISHDFVASFSMLHKCVRQKVEKFEHDVGEHDNISNCYREHIVVSVAASDLDRARDFARRHKIPRAYGNYEDLAKDPEVQVAYVGVIAPAHLNVVTTLLKADKHVLCEKPLGLNYKQVKAMTDLARERKLFFMEAVWSRTFPAYNRIKELVINEGLLGTDNHLPGQRLARRETGGGTVLDWGVYCIQFILAIYGCEKPEKLEGVVRRWSYCPYLNEEIRKIIRTFFMDARFNPSIIQASALAVNHEGVDLGVVVGMQFSGGRVATFCTDLRIDLQCHATISGTKKRLRVSPPFWAPTQIILNNETGQEITEKYPLPIGAKYPFNYTNSQGLLYEADEVRRCLQQGLTESPALTHKESELIAEIQDEIHRQIGVSVYRA